MKEFEKIRDMMCNTITVINYGIKDVGEGSDFVRRRVQNIEGMRLCLQVCNPDPNNVYFIRKWDDGFEFGYYDADSKWTNLAGANHH